MTTDTDIIPPPVITIDGASGTGKGTISQLLAAHLKWHFLDSGVLYRVLALAAQKHGLQLEPEEKLHQNAADLDVMATYLDVQFVSSVGCAAKVILEGEEVTEAIRTEEVGNAASIVGSLPGVRAALLNRQRAFREMPGLVADGRDMGTVVFPGADLKIFLTASLEERASRRHKQLKQGGIDVNLTTLIEELKRRDKRDQERAVAPLKPAHDAVCIDTDHLSIEQVVDRILQEINQKKAFPATSELTMAFVGVE